MPDRIEPNRQPLKVTSMLEVVSTTVGVMEWGVAAVPSLGRVFAWDSRQDASRAILEAVASQAGTVDESGSIDTPEGSIIGVTITAPATESPFMGANDIEATAGRLRFLYHMATGPDPRETENPF